MSRSRRKTPIVGHTTCRSEREDKKLWHQRWRTGERTALASSSPDALSAHLPLLENQVSNVGSYALHRPHLQLTSPYPGCWAPYFPVEFRHDASRRQSAEGLSL
ncbi:hypothetical protein ACTX1L_30805, partial [Pseudomonas aeruginosa]